MTEPVAIVLMSLLFVGEPTHGDARDPHRPLPDGDVSDSHEIPRPDGDIFVPEPTL